MAGFASCYKVEGAACGPVAAKLGPCRCFLGCRRLLGASECKHAMSGLVSMMFCGSTYRSG